MFTFQFEKTLFLGWFTLVVSPVVLVLTKGTIEHYDSIASVSLALFLIAEVQLLNFKNNQLKKATYRAHKGIVALVNNAFKSNDSKAFMEETLKAIEFKKEIGSETPYGYEQYELTLKAFDSTDKKIFIGILTSTIIWGFAGKFY